MSDRADYLIVGQGLAGSLLSYFLLQKGKRITIVDLENKHSSSRIAAGIIHPVTGRRIVKSWMADTFIPFAKNTYAEFETQFGKKFFHAKNIVELLKESKEYNDWIARSESPELANYISLEHVVPYKESLQNFLYATQVLQGGYLDTEPLLNSLNEYFKSNCIMLNEELQFDQLAGKEDKFTYKNIEFEKIIFCEGYKGMMNPYWKHLPWQPSKGELLYIRCAGLKAEEIINRKIFILPLGNDIYKAGSTYAWDSLNEIPTEDAKEKLIHELQKMLCIPFEVIDHVAGVRPTVKERRPFVGFHPAHPHIGIFNGLGTKGVMTGPWLAHHFTQHITNNTVLLEEVNVNRFS